jgi:hypothetical protein
MGRWEVRICLVAAILDHAISDQENLVAD